jgi:hypothetical protein
VDVVEGVQEAELFPFDVEALEEVGVDLKAEFEGKAKNWWGS